MHCTSYQNELRRLPKYTAQSFRMHCTNYQNALLQITRMHCTNYQNVLLQITRMHCTSYHNALHKLPEYTTQATEIHSAKYQNTLWKLSKPEFIAAQTRHVAPPFHQWGLIVVFVTESTKLTALLAILGCTCPCRVL